jgi:hypothetical protein
LSQSQNLYSAEQPALDFFGTFPKWAEDGSFLVFRRLKQEVSLFWNFIKDEAAKESKLLS